jgi:hypothetical protein
MDDYDDFGNEIPTDEPEIAGDWQRDVDEREEPDDPASDLREADRRRAAKAAAPADSIAFQQQFERALNPVAEPETTQDGDDTPLIRRLREIAVGDPQWTELADELLYIAQEREDKKKAAAASALGPREAVGGPELAWDARDLTAVEFKALTEASLGGSRLPPPGSDPRGWRLMLKSLGIG